MSARFYMASRASTRAAESYRIGLGPSEGGGGNFGHVTGVGPVFLDKSLTGL